MKRGILILVAGLTLCLFYTAPFFAGINLAYQIKLESISLIITGTLLLCLGSLIRGRGIFKFFNSKKH